MRERERERERFWGGERDDRRGPRGKAVAVPTVVRSTRVGSGGELGRAGGELGRRLGRARGGDGWAAEPAGPRGKRGGGGRLGCARKPAQEGRGVPFYFPFPIFHNLLLNAFFMETKQVLTPTPITLEWFGMMQQPKKIFLGFTYTNCRANRRYNFGKDQGLARRKGKRKG
jgi:hypothetical protein